MRDAQLEPPFWASIDIFRYPTKELSSAVAQQRGDRTLTQPRKKGGNPDQRQGASSDIAI
jgi:hypothetical protein